MLDLWFVLGLGWGVEGVAVATLIAEWTGLVLGLWMCREVFAGTVWRTRALILAPDRLKRMAVVNGDIMVRSILLEIGFAAFLFKAADFDDVTLAANQILMQFMHITAYALDGFAFSAEALVGQALGARSRATLRRASILTSQWGLVCVAALSAAFLFGGGEIIRWMTTAEDVRTVAYDYLFWMALAPACWSAGMDARRYFYRRDPHPRHAQCDADFCANLSGRDVCADSDLEQSRVVVGNAIVLWSAWPDAGGALSGPRSIGRCTGAFGVNAGKGGVGVFSPPPPPPLRALPGASLLFAL